MTNDRHQLEQQVSAYIDNTLSDAERAAFEQKLKEDGQLQQIMQQQQQISEALHRLFTPPPVPDWARSDRLVAQQQYNGAARSGEPATMTLAPSTSAADAEAPSDRHARRWTRPLAVAAALMLAVVGGWMIWQVASSPSSSGYDVGPWQPPQQIYAQLDEPDWVCESDEQFLSTFRGRLGQPLLLQEPEQGPSMAGLAYRHSITRNTICVLGSAEGEKIVVFIDRIERDNDLHVPPDSGLNVHRKTIGKLVLYEVSTLDQPKLLDLFHLPEEDVPERTGF